MVCLGHFWSSTQVRICPWHFPLSDELLSIFVLKWSGIDVEDLHIILSVLTWSCLAVCDFTCGINSIFNKQLHLKGREMTHFFSQTLSRCIKTNISLTRRAHAMYLDRSGYSWLISFGHGVGGRTQISASAGHSVF